MSMDIQTKQILMKQKRRRVIRENTTAYLMLLPNLIFFCAMGLYPLLWALRYVFYDYDGVTKPIFIGLDNFVRIFTRDPNWWKSVITTFKFGFGKLIIEIPLALVIAAILNNKIRGRAFFRGVFFFPTVTSSAVMSLVFAYMFSSYNGIVNMVLSKLGIISQNLAWLDTPKLAMITVIFMAVWSVYGQNVLLILTGLQGIPLEIYESADLDGANAVQKFFKITIPMIAPMLQIILMLAIIGSLNSMDSILVLTAGGPDRATTVMSLEVYNKFFAESRPDCGYGATQAFISAVIIGIFTIIYNIMTRKMKEIY